jgi:hypothetical protein
MNGINQSDACVKSAVFGDFVRKRLFPASKYDLLLNNIDASTSNREPYFKFKSHDSGREFYVDARYLTEDSDAPVEWCRPSELQKYQEIDNNTPVYISIGAGPQPAAPRQVFLFPIKSIRFNKLLYSYIEKYKISVTRTVEEKDLLELTPN